MYQDHPTPKKGLQKAVLEYLEETAFSDDFYQKVYEPQEKIVYEIVTSMRENHVPEEFVKKAISLTNASANAVLTLLDEVKGLH